MSIRSTLLVFSALAVVSAGVCGRASADPTTSDSVTVVTSYPEQMTTRFQEAFERKYPNIHVRIVWKQRKDAFDMLGQPDGGGADVYWAPSLENYRALAEIGAFAPIGADRKLLPGKLGAQWISDPGGAFEAAEIAGYGVAVNLDSLKRHGLASPKAWRDLASPAFRGQLAVPVAGRVGFSPVLYDIIFQSEGWAPGWALLSEIAANASSAKGGLGPISAVESGDAAVGFAIDFFAAAAAANGEPIAMVYPERTAFVPAHVALMAHAPHPELARSFVDFLLSRDGQRLLLQPDISRHPVRLDAYQPPPPGVADPFSNVDKLFPFDAEKARLRRNAIVALFDVAVTEQLDQLKKLWPLIQQAEAADAAPAQKAAAALAREKAGFVPMTAAQADDPEFLARFASPDFVKAQSEKWRAEIARAREDAFDGLAKAGLR
jgi:phosphoglycerate transport regulatory protein PgtC